MDLKCFKWSAVIITCSSEKESTALTQELALLRDKGHLHRETLCLAVADPSPRLGSGGVTLNALLVAAEHLSAANGHSALCPDLLYSGWTLVLHQGRRYVYEPAGKAFVTLGCQADVARCWPPAGAVINNNLLHLIHICSQLASSGGAGAGVWVASTDCYLHGRLSALSGVRIPAAADAAVVTVPARPEYAQHHGVVSADDDGMVQDVLYQADVKTLEHLSDKDELVQLVAGLVYLSPPVAISLLSLHLVAPLDACTYMGVDSGLPPLQMSLYFDMLAAMARNVSEEAFCSGGCGRTYNLDRNIAEADREQARVARCLMWAELRQYRLHQLPLASFAHTYLDDRRPLGDNLVQRLGEEYVQHHCYIAQRDPTTPAVSRTFHFSDPAGDRAHKHRTHHHRILNDSSEWQHTTVINSKLTYEVKASCADGVITGVTPPHHQGGSCGREVGKDRAIIINSNIKCGLMALGKEVYISGIYLQRIKALVLQDHLALIGYQDFRIQPQDGRVYPPCHGLTYACALFGTGDLLYAHHRHPSATYLNRPWSEFLRRHQVTPDDLWKDLPEERRTLYEARLFPLLGSPDHWTALMLLQDIDVHAAETRNWFHDHQPEPWHHCTRYSIRDFVHGVVPQEEFILRRECFWRIVRKHMIENRRPPNGHTFIPYFVSAKGEGSARVEHELLDSLGVAAGAAPAAAAARLLAATADLLGIMADGQGGLRSGPAGNAAWQPALHDLEFDSISAGVSALAAVRRQWLGASGGPDLLIRAARHYERAAQTLIRLAVMGVMRLVTLQEAARPPLGVWVTATCPARADIAGGWSDTPPICYEMGGLVVDLAIRVDGEKPIGAKVRRSDRVTGVRLRLGSAALAAEQTLVLTSVSDLLDYNCPSSAGALLKCALIVTRIVDITAGSPPMEEQLTQTVGAPGLEAAMWSRLPQGSGLGTSSILAAALVAALWTVTGRQYTKSDVIHATLYMEQVATTGGGWQDIAGGVSGGVIACFSPCTDGGATFRVGVERLAVPAPLAAWLAAHCLLVFTGRVRLARNLLQTVVRSWYAREPHLIDTFHQLVTNARGMRQALLDGAHGAIGEHMSVYNAQKAQLTPSALPEAVQLILGELSPMLLGATIMGAGGGGFLLVMTREAEQLAAVRARLGSLSLHQQNVSVHAVDVDQDGLQVKVGEQQLTLEQERA